MHNLRFYKTENYNYIFHENIKICECAGFETNRKLVFLYYSQK